jgi:hypothetical protein
MEIEWYLSVVQLETTASRSTDAALPLPPLPAGSSAAQGKAELHGTGALLRITTLSRVLHAVDIMLA